ncbi:hypothetical protein MJO28_006073 [Puccinia striiformis f. sp. tritici]|uniref:Uncharacterized protein n=2 Tax=Puccinia striiformis TaxID=27350 RepID=A0A2S4WI89_9BASI|nr:hypothetical protein MJO28_006073 [Puccinia striiformis f. sp. tritici]KAI9608261.1 hypothetical protein KEM48_003395 [Puccinia striiformis f. sp. tritici PST-130]POW21505.1 hypothetical protein PSHT_02319 [Puccinia striiformis]
MSDYHRFLSRGHWWAPQHRRPTRKVVSQPRPITSPSRLNRLQGVMFSIEDLPQEIKNPQPSQRNGIVNVDSLHLEFKEIQLVAASHSKPS